MRHALTGRHPRYPLRTSRLTRPGYLIAAGIAAAALVTSATLTGQPAHAAPKAVAPASRDNGFSYTADILEKATVQREASAARAAVARAALAARVYTVRPGDTLSGIAAAHGLSWTRLWAANQGSVKDPDLIYPGQRIELREGGAVTVTAAAVSHAAPAHRDADQAACTPDCPWGDGDGDSMDMDHSPFQSQSTPAAVSTTASGESDGGGGTAPVYHSRHHYYSSGSSSSGGSYSGGGFQSCVIARESGGNPSAVNPSSGAGGLYQFLPSTWHALGHSGLPENASVAEQNAAFQQAYAQSGTSPWAPYDGC